MTTEITLHDRSSQLVYCHSFSLMGPQLYLGTCLTTDKLELLSQRVCD